MKNQIIKHIKQLEQENAVFSGQFSKNEHIQVHVAINELRIKEAKAFIR